MQQFDCLAPDLNVWGCHFLEASAGTGKTFAIEQVVIRMLTDPDPVKIDSILIVTFTRAAARELRVRIQERIRETIRESQGDTVLLELALSTFDRAHICTIHSFCQQMLMEAGLISESFDDEHVGFVEQQILDFLRTGLKEFSTRQVEKALKSAGGTYKHLVRAVKSELDHQEKIPGFLETLEEMNVAIAQMGGFDETKVIADLEAIAVGYKGIHNRLLEMFPDFRNQVDHLGKILSEGSMSEQELHTFVDAPKLLLSQMEPSQRKKRVKAIDNQDLHYPDLLERLSAHLLPSLIQAHDPKWIIKRMAHRCRNRIDIAKKIQGIKEPDDLLDQFSQAMQLPQFVKHVEAKFAVMMIDEFQDTDAIQWAIFERFFPSMRAFYLVGDPKQSIYAFRNADLYSYLRARDQLAEGARGYLLTNYRSTAGLVEGINAFFSQSVAEGWLQLPAMGKSLDFLPSKSASTDPNGGLTVCLIEDPKARSVPSKDLEVHVLFPFIAKRILDGNHKNYADYAVLIKDRYQGMRLQAYLRRVGIPSTCKNGPSVCTTRVFLLFEALLDAIIHPSNPSKVKRFLSAPLVTLEHSQLIGEAFSTHFQKTALQLNEFKRIWNNEGVGFMLGAVLSSDLIADKMTANEGQDYIDWVHITELLLEYEDGMRKAPEHTRLYLEQLKDLDPDIHPHVKRRSGSDSCAVSIMTTHMSKGLEFDVVFALGMASRQTRVDEEMPEEREAEKLRLLYVAMTRAKTRTYLPLVLTPGKAPKQGQASAAELFFGWCLSDKQDIWSAYTVLEDVNQEKVLQAIPEQVDILELEPVDKVLKAPAREKIELPPLVEHGLAYPPHELSSFSAMTKGCASITHTQIDMPEGEYSIHTLPPGATTGSLLHDLIEKLIQTGAYRKANRDSLDPIVMHALPENLMPWKEAITNMVVQLFSLDFGRFSLKDLPNESMVAEMEFLFSPSDEFTMRGFMDLIVEWEGKYYLIDWKSNWLGASCEDYGQENLTETMEAHEYYLQGRLYRTALTQWLGCKPAGAYFVFLRGLENRETQGIYCDGD